MSFRIARSSGVGSDDLFSDDDDGVLEEFMALKDAMFDCDGLKAG